MLVFWHIIIIHRKRVRGTVLMWQIVYKFHSLLEWGQTIIKVTKYKYNEHTKRTWISSLNCALCYFPSVCFSSHKNTWCKNNDVHPHMHFRKTPGKLRTTSIFYVLTSRLSDWPAQILNFFGHKSDRIFIYICASFRNQGSVGLAGKATVCFGGKDSALRGGGLVNRYL